MKKSTFSKWYVQFLAALLCVAVVYLIYKSFVTGKAEATQTQIEQVIR